MENLEKVTVLHRMIEMMLKTMAIEGDVPMVTLVDIALILSGYGVHYW